ncbi:MAG: cyanophycin synthetase, partial [Bacteroidia bacterium]|nr:cyanophycin synthetase [Bacteroidia bacterium]
RLDLEEMEEYPSDKVDGFSERLESMFPRMVEHRCSVGEKGGFFLRVKEGTWMGHIAEHVALEIQTLAGMFSGYGRTRSTKTKGVYNVVFNYVEEEVGLYAAKAALDIVQSLVDNKPYDLEADLLKMRKIREKERFGPSTASIVDEAKLRGIPYIRLNEHSLVQLGYGVNQTRIQATITDKTSSIAVDIACNKKMTKQLLQKAAIPVAKGGVVYNQEEVDKLIKKIDFPLVFKPINGNHGKGATINVTTSEGAAIALKRAQERSRGAIVERFVEGIDFRILVINNKFIAAAQRTPAHITGDGKSTIQKLIDEVNTDPRRGLGHEKVLTEITINDQTLNIVKEKGYTLKTVLKEDEIFHLKTTANLSTGGTSIDVTHKVHPYNIFMCERISRIIGLDICGVDIMAPDLTKPVTENGGIVLEVNAAPGFRMHLAPSEGLPRNVAAPVIDMLFPTGTPFKIPVIAITGTNGKTTTTRLVSHIFKNKGLRVGFTTSDGIYVQNRMLEKGDTTGPRSAKFILQDPTVELAVLETARGGLLREGLGFDECDMAIITNIREDHLGLKDIHTVQELAKVKNVVVQTVSRDGYAVLNADDEESVKIAKDLRCKIAYFSMNPENPVIERHCRNGGTAAIFEKNFVSIKQGDWIIRIDKITNIPLTFSGTAMFMVENILAASLGAFLRGVKIEDIKHSLLSFIPSPAYTPGRMNIFEFKNYKIMVDFAHNQDGFRAIGKFLDAVDSPNKIGIVAGTGDRRDEDIIELGELSAGMFDHIIIRQDRFLRGRTAENIIELLVQGIHSVDPNKSYEVVPKEIEAIKHSISIAVKDSFITVLSDCIEDAIVMVQDYKNKESDVIMQKQEIESMNMN